MRVSATTTALVFAGVGAAVVIAWQSRPDAARESPPLRLTSDAGDSSESAQPFGARQPPVNLRSPTDAAERGPTGMAATSTVVSANKPYAAVRPAAALFTNRAASRDSKLSVRVSDDDRFSAQVLAGNITQAFADLGMQATDMVVRCDDDPCDVCFVLDKPMPELYFESEPWRATRAFIPYASGEHGITECSMGGATNTQLPICLRLTAALPGGPEETTPPFTLRPDSIELLCSAMLPR